MREKGKPSGREEVNAALSETIRRERESGSPLRERAVNTGLRIAARAVNNVDQPINLISAATAGVTETVVSATTSFNAVENIGTVAATSLVVTFGARPIKKYIQSRSGRHSRQD